MGNLCGSQNDGYAIDFKSDGKGRKTKITKFLSFKDFQGIKRIENLKD